MSTNHLATLKRFGRAFRDCTLVAHHLLDIAVITGVFSHVARARGWGA